MRTLTLLILATVAAAPVVTQSNANYLTPSQIETLERRGWITPAFEAAARELIDSRQMSATAQAEQTQLEEALPDLEKKAAAADSEITRLRHQLARYDHPDETEFTALQAAMKKPGLKLEDQMALAQAYIWTYPTSPHEAEADKFLQQIQKKIADQMQAVAQADAAQAAAQIRLLQGAKAHDLSLNDWRLFLQDKTQDEVSGTLGEPSEKDDDHWVYSGAWTVDPTTTQKAGLSITFNGNRVQNVSPMVPAQ